MKGGSPLLPKISDIIVPLSAQIGITEKNADEVAIIFFTVAPIVYALLPDIPNPLGVPPAFTLAKAGAGAKRRASKSPARR